MKWNKETNKSKKKKPLGGMMSYNHR